MDCEVCQDRGWVIIERQVKACLSCKIMDDDTAANMSSTLFDARYGPMAAVKYDTFTATVELVIKLDSEGGNEATRVAEWVKETIVEALGGPTETVEVKSILVYGP